MAMQTCLAALAHQLAEAQKLADDARKAMEANERRLAIGTVMPLEQRLPECAALLSAVLTLHTWRDRMPSDAELAEQGGVQ
jgi:hypothetical protein